MIKSNKWWGFVALQCAVASQALGATGIKGALDGERFGLFPAEHFQAADGKCGQCAPLKQGLWYFQDELLAVPKPALPVAGYTASSRGADDVAPWGPGAPTAPLPYPPLIWLGAPQLVDNVTLVPGTRQFLSASGATVDFSLTPKIVSNRSYYDASSQAYFSKRPLRMRGTLRQDGDKRIFVARTIWPKDFAIDGAAMKLAPLAQGETLASFVQAEQGGAKSPFTARLIWERTPGKTRQWQDKAAIGVMLNGAQGDDDEAFGGHFAIATGKFGAHGDWSDWMVNNFYNLDNYSEKGIIAAMLPMDNYLADLNSGQQYYRPSYMLVAVLSNGRTAEAYQGGVERVYNHFYRHDFSYRHASANCAGISLDVFKSLGWHIPERGPTSRVKAVGAYAYMAAKEMSLSSGRKIYDYLTEEQIRLYPAVAFEAAGDDLLRLVGAPGAAGRTLSSYEQQLQSDVEALVLVRIPQLPSSRAFGSNPVFSFDEYMARTPADHSKWKIVPVDARPFPPALRDGLAKDEPAPGPVPLPVMGLVAGVIGLGALWRRRRKK